jgi:hypothetical protein
MDPLREPMQKLIDADPMRHLRALEKRVKAIEEAQAALAEPNDDKKPAKK